MVGKFKIPTTCAVVGCHNRQSKHCQISFYRFPKEKERRRRWIAFVSRKNSDGSAWEPGNGDHVCSKHFITGKTSDLFTSPDFVPSIQVNNSRPTECNAALARFERAGHRAKLQTERRRQEEQNTLKDEELICCTARAFDNDHTYVRQLPTEDTQREEPPTLHCRSRPSGCRRRCCSFAPNIVTTRTCCQRLLHPSRNRYGNLDADINGEVKQSINQCSKQLIMNFNSVHMLYTVHLELNMCNCTCSCTCMCAVYQCSKQLIMNFNSVHMLYTVHL